MDISLLKVIGTNKDRYHNTLRRLRGEYIYKVFADISEIRRIEELQRFEKPGQLTA